MPGRLACTAASASLVLTTLCDSDDADGEQQSLGSFFGALSKLALEVDPVEYLVLDYDHLAPPRPGNPPGAQRIGEVGCHDDKRAAPAMQQGGHLQSDRSRHRAKS